MRPLVPLVLAASLLTPPSMALAQTERQQYISDEISLSIRERASNSAGTIGVVRSGERVTVLESLGPESFARIRDAQGREGWVTARFLTDEPAARDRLAELQNALAEAQAEVRRLQAALSTAESQLAAAAPALALAEQNAALEAAVAAAEQRAGAVLERYNDQRAERQKWVTGAALLAGGLFLGLVMPWLTRSRRRRYGDL